MQEESFTFLFLYRDIKSSYCDIIAT